MTLYHSIGGEIFRLLRFAKYEKLSFFPSTTQIQQKRNREISIQRLQGRSFGKGKNDRGLQEIYPKKSR